MAQDDFCIGILPIGEIDPLYLKILAGSFLGELPIKTLILPPLPHPDYAFDKRRLQYDAASMINQLETLVFKDCSKVIALVDADLFIPVFSFVLGEARMGGSCALVSLYRLQENHARAVKVALHEFGHLMNLDHCHEKKCVMRFSKNIEQLDSISNIFCDYCLDHLRYMVRKKP
ncbi:MAG: zinc metallopeptidase [Proteobacteria bacterium]|nr:zinc metallopeptidase [Desulfobacula sp.]MBU3952615.1 zinc metallopeptidase [Pseudomonadota bacterium]MBU4129310.1 zinc metallopeptidase [Pseudomonadota bacterium]